MYASTLLAFPCSSLSLLYLQDGNTPLHLALQSASGFWRLPPLLLHSAVVTVANSAGHTPLHLACQLMDADTLVLLAASSRSTPTLLGELLPLCLDGSTAWSPHPGGSKCTDILLASIGPVHPWSEPRDTEASTASTVTHVNPLQHAKHFAGVRAVTHFVDDHVWEGSAVLPLQVLARRTIRRALAQKWLHTSHTTPIPAFMRDAARALPLPHTLATYVGHPLPSPHYTPGSSFKKMTIFEEIGGPSLNYCVRNNLCAHYNDKHACTYGECGTAGRGASR